MMHKHRCNKRALFSNPARDSTLRLLLTPPFATLFLTDFLLDVDSVQTHPQEKGRTDVLMRVNAGPSPASDASSADVPRAAQCSLLESLAQPREAASLVSQNPALPTIG